MYRWRYQVLRFQPVEQRGGDSSTLLFPDILSPKHSPSKKPTLATASWACPLLLSTAYFSPPCTLSLLDQCGCGMVWAEEAGRHKGGGGLAQGLTCQWGKMLTQLVTSARPPCLWALLVVPICKMGVIIASLSGFDKSQHSADGTWHRISAQKTGPVLFLLSSSHWRVSGSSCRLGKECLQTDS